MVVHTAMYMDSCWIVQTDRQTDRQTLTHTHTHSHSLAHTLTHTKKRSKASRCLGRSQVPGQAMAPVH